MDYVPNTNYKGSTTHRSCENECTPHLDVLATAHSGSVKEHIKHFLRQRREFSAKTAPKETPVKLCMDKPLKTHQNCHPEGPNIPWGSHDIFLGYNFWGQPVPCTSPRGIHGHAKRRGGQM